MTREEKDRWERYPWWKSFFMFTFDYRYRAWLTEQGIIAEDKRKFGND